MGHFEPLVRPFVIGMRQGPEPERVSHRQARGRRETASDRQEKVGMAAVRRLAMESFSVPYCLILLHL